MALTLGIDASTQSVSAILLATEAAQVVAEESVNFGADLPDYGAPQGFIPGGAGGEVHADPRMWLDALDLCLAKLQDAGAPLGEVAAVSGAGQQHGTVYLNDAWFSAVGNLSAQVSLAEQLGGCLSRKTSPIWMDTSTGQECAEIADAVGGDAKVCAISGSNAIERFSGPQIRRFAKSEPDAYAATARIHLVSSFMASVLAGTDAPIDHGDGAGMNLMNLAQLDWDEQLLAATAPDLRKRLPGCVSSATSIGSVAGYFSEKYGIPTGTPVIAFTGDNPSSLVGMGASEPGKVVISLGTSDTLFAAMPQPHTDPNGYGHVFGNPLGGYMSLVCFLNGSLAREKVKERLGVGWDAFDRHGMSKTRPGNDGNLMAPFFGPEITPRGDFSEPVLQGTPEFEAWQDQAAAVRGCLEGQFINMWLQSRWIGVETDTVFLTGGASQNQGIAQVVADIFEADVARLQVSGSVALGAALRAASSCGGNPQQIFERMRASMATKVVHPAPAAASVYASTKKEFAALLQRLVDGGRV